MDKTAYLEYIEAHTVNTYKVGLKFKRNEIIDQASIIRLQNCRFWHIHQIKQAETQ